MTTARHALPSDRDAAIDALAEAFSTDPVFRLLFAPNHGPVDHKLMLEAMGVAYDCFVVNGHTYVLDDAGAALWSPPGIQTDTEAMSTFFGERSIPERMETAFPGFVEMAECHPDEPHFYLQFVGARRRAQGTGVGSRLLGRVLRICDDEGVPAYLEATTSRSAALYARHGFEPLTAITLAEDVSLLPMLRRPDRQDAS